MERHIKICVVIANNGLQQKFFDHLRNMKLNSMKDNIFGVNILQKAVKYIPLRTIP